MCLDLALQGLRRAAPTCHDRHSGLALLLSSKCSWAGRDRPPSAHQRRLMTLAKFMRVQCAYRSPRPYIHGTHTAHNMARPAWSRTSRPLCSVHMHGAHVHTALNIARPAMTEPQTTSTSTPMDVRTMLPWEPFALVKVPPDGFTAMSGSMVAGCPREIASRRCILLY